MATSLTDDQVEEIKKLISTYGYKKSIAALPEIVKALLTPSVSASVSGSRLNITVKLKWSGEQFASSTGSATIL